MFLKHLRNSGIMKSFAFQRLPSVNYIFGHLFLFLQFCLMIRVKTWEKVFRRLRRFIHFSKLINNRCETTRSMLALYTADSNVDH